MGGGGVASPKQRMRAVHHHQLLQLADRRAAGAGAAAAGAPALVPAVQRVKAMCPSAHGRPAPAASAPAWPAGSARGLFLPHLLLRPGPCTPGSRAQQPVLRPFYQRHTPQLSYKRLSMYPGLWQNLRLTPRQPQVLTASRKTQRKAS